MSKRVLITGGAGFVGSHLADGLLSAGHSVRVLDDLTPQVHTIGRPTYLSKDLELIIGDIRDPSRLKEALVGVDVVFHFAATVGVGQSMYEISRYMSVNTQGTAELLQAILDAKHMPEKIVVASSMSIYGEGRYTCRNCKKNTSPPIRSTQQLKLGKWDMQCNECRGLLSPLPTDETKSSEINSVYALSKRDQEELCLIYIYGPRQALSNPYTGVAAVFASRILNDKQPLIFEDGEQMRDFVHVKDIVRANMLAMERPQSNGHVINIGCGAPITIRQVAEKLAHALGRDVFPVITNKYRAGDIRHCYADITKAQALLGYQPQVMQEKGFSELAEWLLAQKAEDKAETMLNELNAYGLTA